MQFGETSVRGLCANVYCNKGAEGKRAEVPLRDTKGAAAYCSRPCASVVRYKTRYRGTNAGPVSREEIQKKMSQA